MCKFTVLRTGTFSIVAAQVGELGGWNIYSHFETGSGRISSVVSLTAAASAPLTLSSAASFHHFFLSPGLRL